MKRDLTNEIGYIYKITSPNGDVYIGQTLCVKKRKYQYKKYAFTKQTKLWNNCLKYNWNPSNYFEVIDECICGEDKCYLNEREIYWISYFNSFNNGLNCTAGGKGQIGRIWREEQKEKQSKLITGMYERNEIPIVINSGHKLSNEHKENISNGLKNHFLNHESWNKGKETPIEVKQKIINSTSGEKNHFYGKNHSEETKEKIRIKKVGIVHTDETKNKMSASHLKRDKTKDKKYTVSVFQFDLNGNLIDKFNSIKEAAEMTNSSRSGINLCCKGIRKSSNNFIWKYNK